MMPTDGSTTLYHAEPWKLNMDVLLLIAVDAHPCDLLSFAYTCKRALQMLEDKSSTLVWKTARSKFQGLPDCPADLTEQEYTDLAFRPRCHGCCKYASTVFWEIRRRYCPDCKVKRLCHISSCPQIIQQRYVLGAECLGLGKEKPLWVDKEQMELFLDEYEHSFDKTQLLFDRQEQLSAIRDHAHKCEPWQRYIESRLLRKREESIFKRLKQHGYEPEAKDAGRSAVRESRPSLFNIPKLLTNNEWDRNWPEWQETMNTFRNKRLERTVFQSRRESLVGEYDAYVKNKSKNISFELLPHVADVARFPPFREIIRAPEGAFEEGYRLFESAFAELPQLVDGWRKKLDAELAELVQIPPHLLPDGGQEAASTSKTDAETFKAPTDKLRLACALFHGGGRGIFTHPDVFFTSMRYHDYPKRDRNDFERSGSIQERFGIKWVKEAPYVVHACGLDPNVATAKDMDGVNARLKCETCGRPSFYNWREATWHAHAHHSSEVVRWERVPDDAKDLAQIKAAERSDDWGPDSWPYSSRCLLCKPRVGDEREHKKTRSHLSCHKIRGLGDREGVDYASLAKVVHRWVDKEQGRFVERRKQLVTRGLFDF